MYNFKVSTKKNKKYDVFKNDKYITSFGDKKYQHYEDITPLKFYKNLNHLDKKRRLNYYKRIWEKRKCKIRKCKMVFT